MVILLHQCSVTQMKKSMTCMLCRAFMCVVLVNYVNFPIIHTKGLLIWIQCMIGRSQSQCLYVHHYCALAYKNVYMGHYFYTTLGRNTTVY